MLITCGKRVLPLDSDCNKFELFLIQKGKKQYKLATSSLWESITKESSSILVSLIMLDWRGVCS